MLHRRASYAALAVVLAFSMSSCDSADILQPTDAAPQFNQGNGNGNGVNNAPGQQRQLWDALADITAYEVDEDHAYIDRSGGSLAAATSADEPTYAFSLVVPRNAVRTSTLFTMGVEDVDDVVSVELTADDGQDIGSRDFNRPVTLCLNLTLADETGTLGLEFEGREIPTYQFTNPEDDNDYLCANLTHFSRFIIIHN
ncbi:MAG: hypothetical protein WEA24_18450 [Gemmatimonadota bacterium]